MALGLRGLAVELGAGELGERWQPEQVRLPR
jgi:hypothetical protein